FRQSQFNLAVQGERQPGSSFKPYVLATALKQGISPATTFPSKPVNIFIGDKYWPVHNYENDYIGSGDLTTATIVSDNSIFAQLTRLVGPANVAKTAHQLGITRHLNPYFAIGLGADAVSPLEMARAFSTFANDGRRVDGSVFGNRPRAIARIGNAAGRLIEENRPVNRVVLDHEQDALLTSILEGVIRSGTRTRPRAHGRLQAERGRRAKRRRHVAGAREAQARRAASDRQCRLQAGAAETAARPRPRSISAQGTAVVVRQGHPRAREAAERRD